MNLVPSPAANGGGGSTTVDGSAAAVMVVDANTGAGTTANTKRASRPILGSSSRQGSKKLSKTDLMDAAERDEFEAFYRKLMGRVRIAKREIFRSSVLVSASQFFIASWITYQRQLIWEHPLEELSVHVILLACTMVTATTRTRFTRPGDTPSRDGAKSSKGVGGVGVVGGSKIEEGGDSDQARGGSSNNNNNNKSRAGSKVSKTSSREDEAYEERLIIVAPAA